MKKTIAVTLTAASLIAGGLAYAQPQPGQQAQPGQQGGPQREHERFSQEDLKAFTEARIAGLKAGLQLTPDQQKNWGPVEQAMREMAQARQARMAQFREARRNEDAIGRMRARADAMTERAALLKKLADASEPLYRSLTDDQKRRMGALIRFAMAGRGHGGGGWHRG